MKTSKVTLGQTTYTIEQHAKEELSIYLAALRKGMEKDTADDTMKDIKLRMSELLDSQLDPTNKTITAAEVAKLKIEFGTPDEIAETNATGVRLVHGKPRMRTSLITGLAVIAIIAGTLAYVYKQNTPPLHQTTQTSTYTNITKVQITADSGNIDITPASKDKTTIVNDLQWRSNRPQVQEYVSGATLYVTTTCVGDSSLWHTNICNVHITAQVPVGAIITAGTQSGNITTQNLQGDQHLTANSGTITATSPQGNVWAQTDSGSINGITLGNGSFTANADSGDVNLQFSDAPSILTSTVTSGNITVSVPSDSTAYHISSSTESGSNTINVNQDVKSPKTMSLKDSSGNITVRYAN